MPPRDSFGMTDWYDATAARAFTIGPKESEAVSHVKERVSKDVVAKLKTVCASRGMRSFLTHEAISRGIGVQAHPDSSQSFTVTH